MSGLVDLTDDDDEIEIISVAPPQRLDLIEITVIEACSAKKEVVQCAPTITVRQLKRKIEEKFDRPSDSQRLIWQGKELKPFTKTLKQFGLKSVGNMVVHLAGVKPTPVAQKREDPAAAAAAAAAKNNNNKKKVSSTAAGKRKSKARASSATDPDIVSSGSGSGRAKRQKKGEAGQSSASSSGVAASSSSSRSARPTEKRAKRMKILSQKLRERQQRALAQRMFLVSRKAISGDAESLVGLAEEFTVLGSTGNVYTVVINRQPRCTCPDHAKGNVCKHIIFVMLRVLGISRDSNLWYQTALLQDELTSMFANAPQRQARTVMASSSVRRALAGASADADEEEENEKDESSRKPFEGEDCAICFETMGKNEDLVWDRDSCGKSIHRACFSMWATHSTRSAHSDDPLCPSCRGVWARAPPAGGASAAGGSVQQREGYVNVADLQGMSSERPAYSPSGWKGRNSRW